MFGLDKDDGTNALDLLKHDHDEVDELFKNFEEIKDGGDDEEKENLVTQICDALTIHAQIEETIFYPAARKALPGEEGKNLLDEAAVEHQTLKDIVGRLEAAPTSDPLYDAGVKVLSEYVEHHVNEEENELFPKVRSSDMDLQAIGRQLAERKRQLQRTEPRASNGGRDRKKQGGEGAMEEGGQRLGKQMPSASERSRGTH
ncbi:MAG TPA: hemerythrin domain-containing protein [Casimicrobiaceae bacterium]|nr:hemerythrin domain-containing protein [Casimicrobiaceae bacterium]